MTKPKIENKLSVLNLIELLNKKNLNKNIEYDNIQLIKEEVVVEIIYNLHTINIHHFLKDNIVYYKIIQEENINNNENKIIISVDYDLYKKMEKIIYNNSYIFISNFRSSIIHNSFVHCMEFFYFATDFILNYKGLNILILPDSERCWGSKYVIDFLIKLSEIVNLIIIGNDEKEKYRNTENKIIYYGKYLKKIKHSYSFVYYDNLTNISREIEKNHKIHDWFPNKNSSIMRSFFIKNENYNKTRNEIKIGLINRKNTRRILNYLELCEEIKNKFGIKVQLVYFDDKSFDFQINFFNKNDIIISSHGAELCSIAFAKKNSLIIECTSEEWCPYEYFSGLSITSDKYHVILNDNHNNDFNWISDKWIKKRKDENRVNQFKINFNVDIKNIINIIDIYLKNNCTLLNNNILLL